MFAPTLILLVDDDSDDRFLFKQAVLENSPGSHILSAINGKEAIHILENSAVLPDIIFMDVNMPIMNGNECLNHIKSNPLFTNIPVVMISTAYSTDLEAKLLGTGAHAFNRKPVSFEALRDMIFAHIYTLAPVSR